MFLWPMEFSFKSFFSLICYHSDSLLWCASLPVQGVSSDWNVPPCLSLSCLISSYLLSGISLSLSVPISHYFKKGPTSSLLTNRNGLFFCVNLSCKRPVRSPMCPGEDRIFHALFFFSSQKVSNNYFVEWKDKWVWVNQLETSRWINAFSSTSLLFPWVKS